MTGTRRGKITMLVLRAAVMASVLALGVHAVRANDPGTTWNIVGWLWLGGAGQLYIDKFASGPWKRWLVRVVERRRARRDVRQWEIDRGLR